MGGRDWTKERWRKQYIREPLQHRAWPVMARGLRELLNALAEDDGTLVRDVEDPAESLLRGLQAQDYELELVEASIGLLLREGFLASDEHSIWIPDLPRAQAQRDAAPVPNNDASPPTTEVRATSTERVRAFRARQRERNATGVSTDSVSETADAPQPAADSVSQPVAPVSSDVSPSRGDNHPESSEPSEIQRTPEQLGHPDQSSQARGIVSARPRDVSAELVSTRWTDDEVSKFVRNPEHALKLPVHERAVFLRAHPRLADALQPERWPEVEAIGTAFAEGIGQTKQYLGSYEKDDGVRRVVELLAVGFPQRSLEYVARVVPKQAWWTANGKRLGLSSLSVEVVRRNMPAEDGHARILNPRVAKVLEGAGIERKAHGAA
ncbi:MAG TPA: hypothetical protein VJN18_00810 [Polyangiaceae bacterium]|nr:hypothetical protein [Polyangiaceae bacterium]